MSLLRNSSIGNKLLIINIASMSVSLFILVLSIVTIMFFSSKNSLSEDAKNQAHILGESVAPAILFNDHEAAKALFVALPPYIKDVTVLDQQGKAFISYSQKADTLNTNAASAVKRFFSEVYISHPILVNNREAGLIQLSASLDKIYDQLAKFLLFTFFHFYSLAQLAF